jgi:hypothetical protein
VDRQFSLENIDTLIEERPVIARLLVGTIGATAAFMIIGIQWASRDGSALSLIVAGALIVIAAALIVITALPIECKIGPMTRRSIPCRLQARRFVVDSIAFGLVLAVIVATFGRMA